MDTLHLVVVPSKQDIGKVPRTKYISNFKKHGIVCKERKEKIINKNKTKFYNNRCQYDFRSYISDGNPLEKHVQTQLHDLFNFPS